MADEPIGKRIEDWFSGMSHDIHIGEEDLDDFREYLESSLDDAEKSSGSDPEGAYGKVVKLASVTSHAARRKPLLVDVLTKYVKRFITILEEVKKALGALSFTLTVSFPFDLSISLTF